MSMLFITEDHSHMSPTAEKIIAIVNNTPLPSDVKAKLNARLTSEDASKESVEAVKQALRSHHAKSLLSQTSILEDKDPEVKSANKKFVQELRQMNQKFMAEMALVEKEAKMIKDDIQDDLTRLEDLVVKSTQQEAN